MTSNTLQDGREQLEKTVSHLCTGFIYPPLLLHWSSLKSLMHIVDLYTLGRPFVVLGWSSPAHFCLDVTTAAAGLTWQSQVNGVLWGRKRLDSLCLSLERRRKRTERVVMVSGWWDERQMVFAGRGRWPSSSGLSMSLSRHCGSLTCSTCHNGSLPF